MKAPAISFTTVSVKIFPKAMILLISTTCLSYRSFLPFAELRKSFFLSLICCTFSQTLFFQVKRSLFKNLELNYALPDDDNGIFDIIVSHFSVIGNCV